MASPKVFFESSAALIERATALIQQDRVLKGILRCRCITNLSLRLGALALGVSAAIFMTKLLLVAAAVTLFSAGCFALYSAQERDKIRRISEELGKNKVALIDDALLLPYKALIASEMYPGEVTSEDTEKFFKFSGAFFDTISLNEGYVPGVSLDSFFGYMISIHNVTISQVTIEKVRRQMKNTELRAALPLKPERLKLLREGLNQLLMDHLATKTKTIEEVVASFREQVTKASEITPVKFPLSIKSVATILSYCPNAEFNYVEPDFTKAKKPLTEDMEQKIIGELLR